MSAPIKPGDIVFVLDMDSIYHQEWGEVDHVDEDGRYHVRIAKDDSHVIPMFDRDEIVRPRNQSYYKSLTA